MCLDAQPGIDPAVVTMDRPPPPLRTITQQQEKERGGGEGGGEGGASSSRISPIRPEQTADGMKRHPPAGSGRVLS